MPHINGPCTCILVSGSEIGEVIPSRAERETALDIYQVIREGTAIAWTLVRNQNRYVLHDLTERVTGFRTLILRPDTRYEIIFTEGMACGAEKGPDFGQS